MPRRALIVDDNRPLAEDLGEILAFEGYEVRVYDDPHEALGHGDFFDVALLDMRMPGMDGVELHLRLSRACPGAQFILMTAYTEDERVQRALASGVRCVLIKPVPLPELLSVMAETAREAQGRNS